MLTMQHTLAVSAIHPAKALLCVGRILYCAPMRAALCGRAQRLERRAMQTAQRFFEKLSDERVIQRCMPHQQPKEQRPLATRKENVAPAEMQKRWTEMMG
jgi:hypothetical protein